MNSTPSFTSTTAYYQDQKETYTNSFIQPTTVVNVGIGLAYQFVK